MVVCCAAMSKPKLFMQSEYKEFEHHMNLNFLGTLKIAQACAKNMEKHKTQGRIVLVGDPLASHYVIPSMSAYSCSKAALE
jgi:short-subunit dehydrogenase